jgi:hypothetical protein
MGCPPHAALSPKTLRADSSASVGMTDRRTPLIDAVSFSHVVSRVRPRKLLRMTVRGRL